MTAKRGRKHPGRRRAWLLGAVTVAAAVALVPTTRAAAGGPALGLRTGAASARNAATAPGPFVTLLFSRTEISAADNCVEDDTNIARLDTTVAPYLQSLGMAGTGTPGTKRTRQSARHCTHYKDHLTPSWGHPPNPPPNYARAVLSPTPPHPRPS